MKYHNSEMNDAPIARIIEMDKEYADYLESIHAHIPETLYFLAKDVNFGDYVIEHWSIDFTARTLQMLIRGEMITNQYDVRWFAITYSGVSGFRFESGQPKHANLAFGKTLEVGNTEVELIDAESKVCEMRWGFVEGSEMVVRFRDITFAYRELPEPERTSVRSAILYTEGQKAIATNDYTVASTKFAEALELAPDHTPTKFQLARAKYYSRDFDSAAALLQEILAEQPKHRGALRYQILVRKEA